MKPIMCYLKIEGLPFEEVEANNTGRMTKNNNMITGKRYKIGRPFHMLRCLSKNKTTLVLMEVHEGVYGSHLKERTLTHVLLRVDYYWSTMIKDKAKFV